VRRKRFQIRANARAAARIESGNGEKNGWNMADGVIHF
jgi:hypothetical protein